MLSQEPSEVLCVDLTLSLWPPATSIRSLMPRLNAFKRPPSQVQGPCAPFCVPKFQLPISTSWLPNIGWTIQPISFDFSKAVQYLEKNQATCFEVLRQGFRPQMLRKLQLKFRHLHLYHWQSVFIFGSTEPQQLPLISVRAAGSRVLENSSREAVLTLDSCFQKHWLEKKWHTIRRKENVCLAFLFNKAVPWAMDLVNSSFLRNGAQRPQNPTTK